MNAKQARLLSDPPTSGQFSNVMQAIEEAVKAEETKITLPHHISAGIEDALKSLGYGVWYDPFCNLADSKTEISW